MKSITRPWLPPLADIFGRVELYNDVTQTKDMFLIQDYCERRKINWPTTK